MARAAAPTFAHRVQLALVQAVEAVAGTLSWRRSWRLGQAIGRLYYRVDARHRRVVRDNLRRSDLGLSEPEIVALSKACFEHFGGLLMATLRLLPCQPDDIRKVTRIEGREHLEAAFAEGKGVIGLTGHMGNWELLALALGLNGWKVAAIGRELDNPLLEAKLRDFRMKCGNTVIPKDGAVRGSIRALKEGRFVGFLLDQDALAAGVFVRYMGRWASTFSTAGMLACRFDLPVLPISSRVDADGFLTVTAHPPFHAEVTGDPQRDAWAATQRMTTWLEQLVKANPSQWFWMHRRFKTQPGPGEPDLPPAAWLADLGLEPPAEA